jgi:hypothetical protein
VKEFERKSDITGVMRKLLQEVQGKNKAILQSIVSLSWPGFGLDLSNWKLELY